MNGEEGRGKDPPTLYMQHPLLDRLHCPKQLRASSLLGAFRGEEALCLCKCLCILPG